MCLDLSLCRFRKSNQIVSLYAITEHFNQVCMLILSEHADRVSKILGLLEHANQVSLRLFLGCIHIIIAFARVHANRDFVAFIGVCMQIEIV